MTHLASVVLPLPDSPTRPKVSPLRRLSETSATAVSCLRPSLKVRTTLSMSSTSPWSPPRSSRLVASTGVDVRHAATSRRRSSSARAGRESPTRLRVVRRVGGGVGRHGLGLRRGPSTACVARPGEEVRLAALADRLRHGTARRVDAALERIAERRQRTGDGLQRSVGLVHAEARHAAQQPHGVRVPRVGEDVLGRALFDEPAGVQDADPLAEAHDQSEVVRDQQDGGVDAPAQLLDEVEDLRLHGGVEAGGGLVEDEQLRVDGERHGDDDTLLLPAGEFERIAAQGRVGVGDGHAAQALARLLERRLLVQALVIVVDLGELVADLHRRAQRLRRVLVDHGHLAAAPLAQGLLAQLADVLAVDQHPTVVERAVGGEVAHGGHGEGGLAAARLADEAVGLAALDLERDALEHRQPAAAAVERDLEVADVEGGGVAGRLWILRGAHLENVLPSPSVMRLMATTSDARAAAGNRTVHGAICR